MQNPVNNAARIISRYIQKNITYKSINIVTIDITYPQIHLNRSFEIQTSINSFYQGEAYNFANHGATELKNNAIEHYEYATRNGYPFNAYDAVMKYTVTLNDNCLLSTYFDQYEYTGGAHGMTVRSSSNWDLLTGASIEMEDLFEPQVDYSQLVIDQILKTANQQVSTGNTMYFEDYQELIVKYFNPEHFNLSPTGIIVYYQLYEIGPYASGIIEFDIPYENLGITGLGC